MQNRTSIQPFAADWAAAWNRRDIEAVLAHFHDDIVFTSPTALSVTGNAVVRGKGELRAYWAKALSRIGSLHFSVERVLWDDESRELAIVYLSRVDGNAKYMSENLVFDAQGEVVTGEVFHGVPA
jgi:hypothetical protein